MVGTTNENSSAAIPASTPPADAGGRYRWSICALLFFATTINYIDRQILSLLKPILDNQLHWTNTEFGWVNGAFQFAYAVGLLGFGRIVDRFGTKVGYAISIFVWSVSAMGHALVGSVSGFVTARVCLGLGESGNFPSAIKAVAIWFPKKERAFATSIFNSGANVGPLLAPLVVPWIALHYGWHAAFILAGVLGLIWLVFWTLLYQVPQKSPRLSAAELAYIDSDRDEGHVEGPHPIEWKVLLSHKQAWSFIAAKALTDPVWWFFLIWLPDYFKQTRNLDLHHSWKYLVAIYGMVTVLSIIGGWVPGRLIRAGWSVTAARKVCLIVFALCVVPIIFATSIGTWGAVILIGLAASSHQAWSANIYSTVSDMFPKRAVATLTGIGGTAGSITGICFPVYTGWLLDRFKASGNETGGYSILFATCAFAYVVAFIVQHLLAPRFEPVDLGSAGGSPLNGTASNIGD
jgi:ACS family hexuronate transporter-like MFS transporter